MNLPCILSSCGSKSFKCTYFLWNELNEDNKLSDTGSLWKCTVVDKLCTYNDRWLMEEPSAVTLKGILWFQSTYLYNWMNREKVWNHAYNSDINDFVTYILVFHQEQAVKLWNEKFWDLYMPL